MLRSPLNLLPHSSKPMLPLPKGRPSCTPAVPHACSAEPLEQTTFPEMDTLSYDCAHIWGCLNLALII